MRLTILGSGSAVPRPGRMPPGYLLEIAGQRVLLDAGPGTLGRLAERGVPPWHLDAVVLTHLHVDHALDVVQLLFHRAWADRAQVRSGLRLLGPPGFRDELSSWLAAIYPPTLADNPDLRWHELDDRPVEQGSWSLRAVPVAHRTGGPSGAVGVRLTSAEGSLSYTGDSGPCAGLDTLLDADGCLVSECNDPVGDSATHLSPAAIRALVDRCPPALLLLTHVHEAFAPGALPGPAFDGYTAPVAVAEDGLGVVWRAGRPVVEPRSA